MVRTPLSEQQQARKQQLVEALRPHFEALLDDAAALLAAQADSHPFGRTEFALRDLVHATAADCLQTSLEQKKTAIRELP